MMDNLSLLVMVYSDKKAFLNKDLVDNGEVDFFSKDFGGLMPFSQYTLSVYARTVEGSYNPDFPLELSFRVSVPF